MKRNDGTMRAKGYVTTLGPLKGMSVGNLEKALGFVVGALGNGYILYKLVEPVCLGEFDWKDRTRYSNGWQYVDVWDGLEQRREAVQRYDLRRSALAKMHGNGGGDKEIDNAMAEELVKLNVRFGPGQIVKIIPTHGRPSGFPNSECRNIPQWKLNVEKLFSLISGQV